MICPWSHRSWFNCCSTFATAFHYFSEKIDPHLIVLSFAINWTLSRKKILIYQLGHYFIEAFSMPCPSARPQMSVNQVVLRYLMPSRLET